MNVKSSNRSQPGTRRPAVLFLLPVRTTRTPWQVVKSWLLQLWQHWRTPGLVVQPPLQPGRQKPFPQRPHQQRRHTVFATLNAAPAGLTRAQLIAHVRAVTGVGCSEKLITQWRKERQGDTAMGRHGDGGTERRSDGRMGRGGVLGAILCLGINACATTTTTVAPPSAPAEIMISPTLSEFSNISNLQSPISNPPIPRLLRIKLTLNAAHELRVKLGDELQAGMLLTDRMQTRQRLLVQKRALQSAAQHLQTQMKLLAASLRQLQALGLNLPPTTFAAEQAAIQRAEAEAIAVNRAVDIQKQKVLVAGGPWSVVGNEPFVPRESAPTTDTHTTSNQPPATDHRSLIQQHEEAKLAQAQDKQLLALSEIEWHKARLTTAREVRAWDEQKHRVEVTRQLLSARSQQQQGEIELARLIAQRAELNLQLAQLAEVRAPFAGHIKRIEWEEMNDEKLTVLVYLAVTQ